MNGNPHHCAETRDQFQENAVWVLETVKGGGKVFYKSYDFVAKSVVQCDSRGYAKVFPSRTAAEGEADFHGLHDYTPATLWG